MSTRFKQVLVAQLILEKDNKFLLSKRQNTGLYDGLYGFVGGHCEGEETIKQTMLRETKEEIGIDLKNIKLVHVLHSFIGFPLMHFFFHCNEWEGTIQNCEPERCGDLKFFALDNLPEKSTSFVYLLKDIKKGLFYSEWGWDDITTLSGKA